ncbi:MAG TPA: hypothetical protein DD490_27125 [Acidobacteria bacterium]|nr:hypothetical protein [Acidobacteriota bacterium]
MATEKHDNPVHEMAGGWITERKGTPVPLFLKLAYVGFSLFGLYYLFTYYKGELGHATRGALVGAFNQTSEVPGMGWIAFLGVVLGLYVIGLFWYAFAAKEEEGEE